MSDDFYDLDLPDFDSEDEFDDEAFDAFGDDDVHDLHVRTAVLKKRNMVALLCIKTASEGAAICRVGLMERPVETAEDRDDRIAVAERHRS